MTSHMSFFRVIRCRDPNYIYIIRGEHHYIQNEIHLAHIYSMNCIRTLMLLDSSIRMSLPKEVQVC